MMIGSCFNLSMLAIESQQVVALRLAKLSLGGMGAWREGQLMLVEKVQAALAATFRVAGGATTDSIVDDYRKTVQANVVRLSRG